MLLAYMNVAEELVLHVIMANMFPCFPSMSIDLSEVEEVVQLEDGAERTLRILNK